MGQGMSTATSIGSTTAGCRLLGSVCMGPSVLEVRLWPEVQIRQACPFKQNLERLVRAAGLSIKDDLKTCADGGIPNVPHQLAGAVAYTQDEATAQILSPSLDSSVERC